jgi:hypothetical protein
VSQKAIREQFAAIGKGARRLASNRQNTTLFVNRNPPSRNWYFFSGVAFVLIGLLASSLAACSNDDQPAPKPTINSDAHVYTTVRILVSDPRIDDVQVESEWVVGNLGCAPIIYPEGYARVQQVSTPEQVKKIDGGYQARPLADRFQHDKCNWQDGGMSVSFMQRGHGFAVLGMGLNELNAGMQHVLICTPPLNIEERQLTGVCYPPESSTPQLEKMPGKFTVTLEVLRFN